MRNLLHTFCSVAIIAWSIVSYQNAFAETHYEGLIKEDFSSLRYSFPVSEGWSSEKLSRAMLYAQELGSSAIVVLHKGELVLEWGRTALRINSHSVRKSLLSALYGVAVEKNLIDLSLTMTDLGIDDRPPCLDDTEKQATVLDLLKSRSGVFHEAAYESEGMKRGRPSRGAFDVGGHWYYNNWDFNVLGTIFERRTNLTIGQAFQEWIADPIGMQDFRAEDVHYRWEEVSLHPAYPFWVSARDLARFGQLYLNNGNWNGAQVIPSGWIRESTAAYSDTSRGGYGYMWWIHPSGAYYAHGHMGQFVLVIPEQEIVIVSRVFTGTPSFNRLPAEIWHELQGVVRPIHFEQFKRLVDLIVEAAPYREKL
jgi:CubicO group peptidase (beta-lactamase class C family)